EHPLPASFVVVRQPRPGYAAVRRLELQWAAGDGAREGDVRLPLHDGVGRSGRARKFDPLGVLPLQVTKAEIGIKIVVEAGSRLDDGGALPLEIVWRLDTEIASDHHRHAVLADV